MPLQDVRCKILAEEVQYRKAAYARLQVGTLLTMQSSRPVPLQHLNYFTGPWG
jgi:hypothetical protein